MRRIQKSLLITVSIALMFAVVPFALAQDQPPQPPPTPPPDVNVNVSVPWGTILLVALGVLVLFALIGLVGRSSTETHTIEHVEEPHHHHDSV
jgi:hypothetical protein